MGLLMKAQVRLPAPKPLGGSWPPLPEQSEQVDAFVGIGGLEPPRHTTVALAMCPRPGCPQAQSHEQVSSLHKNLGLRAQARVASPGQLSRLNICGPRQLSQNTVSQRRQYMSPQKQRSSHCRVRTSTETSGCPSLSGSPHRCLTAADPSTCRRASAPPHPLRYTPATS